MRYAPFLAQNGTIGFVAPSFGCNIEPYRSAFENAIIKFHNMGYQTSLGPNCYEGSGIGISNTPEKCGAELMEYYCSQDNDVLISCGGGELMCEVLGHLDLEKMKATLPKWYIGYSDNTNMTFLQATICDTAAVYGPCAAAYGMQAWHPAIDAAFDILKGSSPVKKGQENGFWDSLIAEPFAKEHVLTVKAFDKWEKESIKDEEHPLAPYNCTENSTVRVYMPGTEEPVLIDMNKIHAQKDESIAIDNHYVHMTGRLLGGCVDCLVNLLGTRYDKVSDFNERYSEDGVIWFLEACDLNVMSIRRAMWQMENAGWFDKVKGFMIGRPLCHGQDLFGLDQYRAVLDIIKHHNVPVIMDVDIGHIPPMMPLVCGSLGEVIVNDRGVGVNMHLC